MDRVIERQCVTESTVTMSYRFRLGALLVVLCLCVSGRVDVQERTDPMAATIAGTLGLLASQFISLADAMPEDKWSFKPAAGEFTRVRTFAEQVKHVACANFGFFNPIEGIEPPEDCVSGGPHPATTKAELMTYLRESFEYVGRLGRLTTPANALDPVNGPYGGAGTRLGRAMLAVWHGSDHYGQLVVYLRMNGIVPPASRSSQ